MNDASSSHASMVEAKVLIPVKLDREGTPHSIMAFRNAGGAASYTWDYAAWGEHCAHLWTYKTLAPGS